MVRGDNQWTASGDIAKTLDLGAKENHEEGRPEGPQSAVGQIVHAHNLTPFLLNWVSLCEYKA